ncbi:MAG: hypothetical protein ACI8PP_003241 [Candidatus Pseudothioglobus sp.]|jgi:hypothetical protein
MFVNYSDSHVSELSELHQPLVHFNQAKHRWIACVRQLDIEFMTPFQAHFFQGRCCAMPAHLGR